MKARRIVHVGVSVGHDRLVACARGGGEWRISLDGAPSPDARWPALESALTDLRAALPAGRRVVASVGLLSPLVQVRRLRLPPLRASERRRVLGRDAARHFIGARETFVADALPIAGTENEVIAVGAPARVVEAIVYAASAAGIAVRTIQAAPWCWAASVDPRRRSSTTAVVAHHECAMEIVSLGAGTVTGVRRRRIGAAPTIDVDHAGAVVEIMDGAAAAAAHADHARGPELLPESMVVARRAALARLARMLVGGAAALLVLSAGIELVSVRRQLAAVRAERAALRERVARAMASRDSATVLETRLAVIASEIAGTPRWTAVIAGLSRDLPADASLTSFAASGDSIALAGQAAHAADVFEALRRHPGITGIRADAPIRREMAPDRAPVERFSVTVRMNRDGLLSTSVADDGGTAP